MQSPDHWKEPLQRFLEKHPFSKLEVPSDGPCKDMTSIIRPWNDSTLNIQLPEEIEPTLVESLNNLFLNPHFSAVIHRDSGDLEVLWTAFKLTGSAEDLDRRRFRFVWKGREFECSFENSSERLLRFLEHVVPVRAPGSTDHRNTASFRLLLRDREHPLLDKARSFFIRGFEGNETISQDFIKHLNANMTYFDRRTPYVLIHSDVETAEETFAGLNRYIKDTFPAVIRANEIDTNMLSYWNEIYLTSDEIMKFLLCYRMIEYAAFSYMNSSAKQELKRELLCPSFHSDLDVSINKLVEVFVRNTKEIDAIPRMQNVVVSAVDLQLLWGAIESNKDYFSSDIEFDGGFTIKALMSKKCDFENWKSNGVRNTMDRLRGIRNALAHGQDGSTRGTIQPTSQNATKLTPWLNVIEITAGEVMFRHNFI